MENPFIQKANAQRGGCDRIVSPQESHISRDSDDGSEGSNPIGEAASNPGSSYKPKPQGG